MRNALLVMLPLCLGLLVYYSRPLFVSWYIVRNYLPDACWAFSFTFAWLVLWKGNHTFLVRSIPLVLFIGFELMQQSGTLTGTFDYFDCLVYVLAYLLATGIVHKYE